MTGERKNTDKIPVIQSIINEPSVRRALEDEGVDKDRFFDLSAFQTELLAELHSETAKNADDKVYHCARRAAQIVKGTYKRYDIPVIPVEKNEKPEHFTCNDENLPDIVRATIEAPSVYKALLNANVDVEAIDTDKYFHIFADVMHSDYAFRHTDEQIAIRAYNIMTGYTIEEPPEEKREVRKKDKEVERAQKYLANRYRKLRPYEVVLAIASAVILIILVLKKMFLE